MIPTAEVETWHVDVDFDVAREPEPVVEIAKPHVVATILRRGLLLFAAVVAAFLIFGLWLSGLEHARSQVGLQRRFRAEIASISAPIDGTIAPGAPVADIRIPRIGVNEVVVEGARSSQLRAGPGHVVGTPLPGQPGNAVIAGRRYLYGGPFEHLGSLHAGDRIAVVTGQGTATYRVTGRAKKVGATHGSVFADHGDNRLTLITADPPLRGSRRLVVTAKLVERPYAATNLSRTLDPEGLGLTGERGAIAIVLVWLELLAGLALLTVYATKRWSRWAAWVVFVPGLALVVWLLFDNAVRLLPATL